MKITSSTILSWLFLVNPSTALNDGFSPIPNIQAAPDDPATLFGFRLTSPTALYLDGSPGMYYYRPGLETKKWFIYHEGGGWCDSLEDCLSRSLTDLGSSKNYVNSISHNEQFFSLDPSTNPLMHNWTMVYLKYCDGNSFAGSNSSTSLVGNTTLYWRGNHILHSTMEQLRTQHGLADATDVVISGCSAGGLATFLHCDSWADATIQAHVACVPQSGFFFDGSPSYHASMTWAFHQQNATMNRDCMDHEIPQSNCNFAQHLLKYIQTPIFPLQSAYDTWQVDNEVFSNDVTIINDWGRNLTKALWKNLLLVLPKRTNGVFLDSCSHHCGAWSIAIHGETQATAMMKWYNQVGRRIWVQGKDYPCVECCGDTVALAA